MDRIKNYSTKQSRTFARPLLHEVHRSYAGHTAREAGLECGRVLEQGCGNRVIAIDLSPSDVALARALA